MKSFIFLSFCEKRGRKEPHSMYQRPCTRVQRKEGNQDRIVLTTAFVLINGIVNMTMITTLNARRLFQVTYWERLAL